MAEVLIKKVDIEIFNAIRSIYNSLYTPCVGFCAQNVLGDCFMNWSKVERDLIGVDRDHLVTCPSRRISTVNYRMGSDTIASTGTPNQTFFAILS